MKQNPIRTQRRTENISIKRVDAHDVQQNPNQILSGRHGPSEIQSNLQLKAELIKWENARVRSLTCTLAPYSFGYKHCLTIDISDDH